GIRQSRQDRWPRRHRERRGDLEIHRGGTDQGAARRADPDPPAVTFVLARSDPPSLASRATAGFESAEARSAKAEATKQSRATGAADAALDCFASLAMTVARSECK